MFEYGINSTSIHTSWVVGLLIVAATVIWRQLRLLINEWRLYHRKQKYPQMVIYKLTPKKLVPPTRTLSSLQAIDWLLVSTMGIMRCTISFFFLAREAILSTANVYSVRRAIYGTDTDPTTPSLGGQLFVQPNHAVHESFSHQIDIPENDDSVASESFPTESYAGLQHRQGTLIVLPTMQTDQSVSNEIRPLQQLPFSIRHQRPLPHGMPQATTISMQKSDQIVQSPAPTTMIMTQFFPVDSSPLSAQIRKRRLNGEDVDLGRIAKMRRLNDARTTLKGCAVRPRAYWQCRPSLNKREREEREGRILNDMYSKQLKLTGAPGSAQAGITAGVSFQFGDTSTSNKDSDAAQGSGTKLPLVFGKGYQSTCASTALSQTEQPEQPIASHLAKVDGNTSYSNPNQPFASVSQADSQNVTALLDTPVQTTNRWNTPGQSMTPSSQLGMNGPAYENFRHSMNQQEASNPPSVSAGQQPTQAGIFGSIRENEKNTPALPRVPTPAMNGANDIAGTGMNSANINPRVANGKIKPTFGVPAPLQSVQYGAVSTTSVLGSTVSLGMNGVNREAQPHPPALNGNNKLFSGLATQVSSGSGASTSSTMPPFALGTNGGYGPKFGLKQGQELGTAGARRRAAKQRIRQR